AVSNAVADGSGDLAPALWTQCASHRISSERERQSGLFLPPDAEIYHAVQPLLRKEKLSLVDKQACFDYVVLNSIDDFVERHGHRLKVWLEKFQSEICGSFQARDANSLAGKLLWLHRFCGDDDGAVAFAEACPAIEKNILLAETRVSGEANGRDVIRFRKRGFVQRLNVRKNVRVFVTGRGELVGRQRVEHKCVVGIRRMRQLDFDGRGLGLRGCL